MIQIIITLDEIFCHILPMLDGLNELIKLSQSQLCFVCDLFLSMNLCQTYFYFWYNDPLLLKYKRCVPWVLEFFEYNVKCSDARIDTYSKHKFGGLELPNFWHFIMMYCYCPQRVFYVLMIQVAFQ
jgi:hypothetical protein